MRSHLALQPGASGSSRSRFARTRSAISLVAALAAAWVMLPASFGGRTTYTVVSGRSMEPTYHTYDLAITYRTASVGVGDVIVYRVPEGEPGAGGQVIHRVVGGDGVNGYVTRGDNREGPDSWRPRSADVVGKVVTLVPRGGRLLSMMFNPGNLGLVAVGFLAWALWPRPEESEDESRSSLISPVATEPAGR